MEFTTPIILSGIFSILLVAVFIIVGVKIMSKYSETSDKIYLLTGFGWLGISEPWWPSAVGFLIALSFGVELTLATYLILNNSLLPIFLCAWLIAITEMMNINRRNLLVLVYAAIAACLEAIMLYFIFTDISMAGKYNSPVDIDFGPATIIHLIYNLLVFMISGFWLTINTLRLKDSENRLRGKFLLIAFLLFLVGAILEMIIFNPINRTIVLLAAIIFYIGFTMPEKIKNKIIKM